MKIGEVAQQANVTVDTLRFYERKGVLSPPARRPSGYRDYAASAVDRLRFARSLQDLGLTLDEIVLVLGNVDRGTATCAMERKRFEQALNRIEKKIAELNQARGRLTRALDSCASGKCSLLQR
jgi:DNA-binding transcriptional MerR regulator